MDDVEPENAVDPAPQSGAHGTVDTTTAVIIPCKACWV